MPARRLHSGVDVALLDNKRLRWREKRDTMLGRRRQRRLRRRDVRRAGDYDPVDIDPGVARRGVRIRLWTAAGTLGVTAICFAIVVVTSLSTFGSIFALTSGLASLGASIGLLMSARHEEQVHEVASELDDESEAPVLPEPDEMEVGALASETGRRAPAGTDGSVGPDHLSRTDDG